MIEIDLCNDTCMDAQLENWKRFCIHHAIGDWHGTWTRYDLEGKQIESFKGIRSLRASIDGTEINHQNHYTYADGRTEVKTFGPYQKPITNALFLDNSFSWGSITLSPGSPFGFETGFRYEDKRASAAAIYDENSKLKSITIIPEHLTSITKKTPHRFESELNANWQGSLTKIMTPDLIVRSAVVTAWNPLENLGEDYLTFNFTDGVSVSFPQQLENGKKFFLAVDWQIDNNMIQRGIRHFDASGFTSFVLQTFNRVV